jgi:membrane associated rhomboid family serine protease
MFIPLKDNNPSRSYPVVNISLILANIAAFLYQNTLPLGDSKSFELAYSTIPARIPAFFDGHIGFVAAFLPLFTSMFLHHGLLHLAGNMLFLWIFGDNVEDAMGHLRYLVFYLLGGICAAVAQGLAAPTMPMLGASGAISAVLAAYAFLYPSSPVDVINPVPILWLFYGFLLRLPAWLVIAAFFAINLWSVLVGAGGGVAFMAHIGGFVAGVVMLRPFMAGRERMDDYSRHERWARRRGEPGW